MSTEIERNRIDIEHIREGINKDRLEMDRFRQEMRWQPYLAIATILGGVAAMSGVILAVSHFIK